MEQYVQRNRRGGAWGMVCVAEAQVCRCGSREGPGEEARPDTPELRT